jgi:hypothetical protein
VGWFSFLTPSPERRIERARRMLETGRAEFARLEVLELDHPEARKVLEAAETELARRNLEAALRYGSQRDDERAAACLELAETFHHGGLEQLFQDTRRELREFRSARDPAEERQREDTNARLMAVDPLGLQGGPTLLDPVFDPAAFGEDHEEIEARLALIIENYPETLRERVGDLGADFAGAVLALDEGRASESLAVLAAMSDDEPLVWWERARAAHALDDAAAAARAVRTFASLAGRHHPMGSLHSGAFLAQLLAETGDLAGALRVLREVRLTEPKVGGLLYAQLLTASKQWPEAETLLVELIRQHPTESRLYTDLARVRLGAELRPAALRALEAGLEACCGSPGKCGTKPPDLETHRMLATLYLEDGSDLARGLELATTAEALVQRPTWDDAYLQALAARRRQDPRAGDLVGRLHATTPPEHPGASRLGRYLPAS